MLLIKYLWLNAKKKPIQPSLLINFANPLGARVDPTARFARLCELLTPIKLQRAAYLLVGVSGFFEPGDIGKILFSNLYSVKC